MDPHYRIQSDKDIVNILFLTIDDQNPAINDARNTISGDHSQDIIKVVQVQDGASALTLNPAQGGVEVAQYPFGFFTADNDPDVTSPENPGTVLEGEENFYDRVFASDAGVNGDAVIYYVQPTAAEIRIGGVYTLPQPAGTRLFAANFTGAASTLTSTQISTDTGSNLAQAQVLGLLDPMTRGITTTSALGKYHLIMWLEDRGSSAGFISGGALMSTRYNKAILESSPSGSVLVTTGTAFKPALTDGPVQADFDSGDSLSFPVGWGLQAGSMDLYFTQFGEIYYSEYSEETGKWWTDESGLPDPTLVSNEGFPGMPNSFIQAITGQDTGMFGVQVNGNYIVQEFTATINGSSVTVRRFDNRSKALVLYAKDDGGWDPENDGTGFNRLFCRIRD
jgi:hypothetical protein